MVIIFSICGSGSQIWTSLLNQGDKPSNQSVRNIRSMPSRVPELPFSAFWKVILQNYEDYKTSYKVHKR